MLPSSPIADGIDLRPVQVRHLPVIREAIDRLGIYDTTLDCIGVLPGRHSQGLDWLNKRMVDGGHGASDLGGATQPQSPRDRDPHASYRRRRPVVHPHSRTLGSAASLGPGGDSPGRQDRPIRPGDGGAAGARRPWTHQHRSASAGLLRCSRDLPDTFGLLDSPVAEPGCVDVGDPRAGDERIQG